MEFEEAIKKVCEGFEFELIIGKELEVEYVKRAYQLMLKDLKENRFTKEDVIKAYNDGKQNVLDTALKNGDFFMNSDEYFNKEFNNK